MVFSKKFNGVKGSSVKKEYQDALESVADFRGRALFYPYIASGRGNGPYVELEDGSVKIDTTCGIGVHILGHNHHLLKKALKKGMKSSVIMEGNLQPGKSYVAAGKKLAEIARENSSLYHAWITTCGSRANEKALKIARQHRHPAKYILAFEKSFAGRTIMMHEITDKVLDRQPTYGEVLRVPFYDKSDSQSIQKSLSVLKKHIEEKKDQIAVFSLELMQGEGGYRTAPKEFFVELFEECKKNNILVWVDEVQTFMRTGNFFAYETLGLGKYIDLCTIGKSAQMAAVLFKKEINPAAGLIAGTFSGSSGSLWAFHDLVCEMQQGNYLGKEGKIEEIHQSFLKMLKEVSVETNGLLADDAGGMGLMVAVTPYKGEREKVMKLLKILFKNGLIIFGCGDNPFRLRFLLPLILKPKHTSEIKKILIESLREANS